MGLDLAVARSNPLAKSLPTSVPYRPGRVVKLRGIILQSDKTSIAGACHWMAADLRRRGWPHFSRTP
jgi:hypothetical protein